jgi:DNA-binding XRE family transcriptional regulator
MSAAHPIPSAEHKAPAANHVRMHRVERMMSKAELARRAGVSTLTIDRVERGLSCRMDTKRKILEALGMKPLDRRRVFPSEEE